MSVGRHPLAFGLIAASTALGIAGTDLVLPAIPALPDALGGTAAAAQFVIAAFTAGLAIGLLVFGELGSRFDQRKLLVASLLSYAGASLLCRFSTSLDMLVPLRFVQGLSGAAALTFAPGMLRALYGDQRAISAIGLLGSIEAMAPALAPLAGLWLISLFDWRASFDVIAIVGTVLAAIIWLRRDRLPRLTARRGIGGYRRLFTNGPFLRQALSHAFSLGTLLVIVFGAPTVFVTVLDRPFSDFIVMQVAGITAFVIAANTTGRLVPRLGAERLIVGGTLLLAAGATALFVYALAGGESTLWVTGLFLLVNTGFGLRGPPGFHAAIVAADDDARGAALLTVAILMTAAIGTAIVAPFISAGLISITAGGMVLSSASLVMLRLLPRT